MENIHKLENVSRNSLKFLAAYLIRGIVEVRNIAIDSFHGTCLSSKQYQRNRARQNWPNTVLERTELQHAKFCYN